MSIEHRAAEYLGSISPDELKQFVTVEDDDEEDTDDLVESEPHFNYDDEGYEIVEVKVIVRKTVKTAP